MDSGAHRSRLKTIRVYAVPGIVCMGIAVGAWSWLTQTDTTRPPDSTPTQLPPLDSRPPDPRVAFPTQFRHVRPETRYVGDAACTGCHAAIARSYRLHPMGRSAERVGPLATVDHAAGVNNPCTASVYSLAVER